MGPVQLLIVLGVDQCDFHEDLIAELERLHDADVLRVMDALALCKNVDGEIEVRQLIERSADEAIEVGCAGDVLDEIPNDSEAALVLLQHHWALRLHDVIASVGGFRISDGFIISPLDVGRLRVPVPEPSAPLPARATAARAG
ncbi:MAG TPA: hypothetical protein VHX62_00685 [Solirubrobacteraceae bacterium]|nr:hypothetical protein [Solirubrobacteraceae bacterium]